MEPLISSPGRRRLDKAGYLAEDTIAAIATGLGGAVAIVRVSGPDSARALRTLAPGRSQPLEARKLFRVNLKNRRGEPLDDALIVWFPAPNSYTGEDSLELHIHGGSFVAQRVMEALVEEGVRPALPGEFSFRAVRNGKMSITQAQAVADLIAASNEGAVELALEKMSGSQNRLIRDLAESLRVVTALGEVGIDFSDQDLEEVSLPALRRRVVPIRDGLERLRQSHARGSRLQDGIRVAFIGLPNAGKSSLFNALLGEDRSIVSDIAGTTRDVVRERITLRGRNGSVSLRLEDTAGLRMAKDRVEELGIQRSRAVAGQAELVLLIVDSSSGQSEFRDLISQWRELGEPGNKTLGVLTKADLDSGEASDALDFLRSLALRRVISTSAVSGEGIAEMVEEVVEHSSALVHRDPGEVLLTRLEHLHAVEEGVQHLERALIAQEIDLFAADLRHALNALQPIIGETLPDDILGRIFSQFCIGK